MEKGNVVTVIGAEGVNDFNGRIKGINGEVFIIEDRNNPKHVAEVTVDVITPQDTREWYTRYLMVADGCTKLGAETIIDWLDEMGDPMNLNDYAHVGMYLREVTSETYENDSDNELTIPLSNGNYIIGNW